MAALNSQTAVQFQQYAAQQYPGNCEQQQILIRQLQEQHYQQYMQQLYQVQLAQQQVGGRSACGLGGVQFHWALFFLSKSLIDFALASGRKELLGDLY